MLENAKIVKKQEEIEEEAEYLASLSHI